MKDSIFTNDQCLAEALAVAGLAESIDTLLFDSPDKKDTEKNLEAAYAVSQVLREKSRWLSHMLDHICDQHVETQAQPQSDADTHHSRVDNLEASLTDVEGLVEALEIVCWELCGETIHDPRLVKLRSAVIALSSSLDRIVKEAVPQPGKEAA